MKPFSGYAVKPIPYVIANIIQCANHYKHTRVTSITHSFGLYDEAERIVGVLMFGPPSGANVTKSFFGANPVKVRELKRLWVHDSIAKNGESYFMAAAFKLLSATIEAIVTYADPEYHTGRVYLAANFSYCGQGTAQSVYTIEGISYNARALLNGVTTQELRAMFGENLDVTRAPGKLRYAIIIAKSRTRRILLDSLLSVASSQGQEQDFSKIARAKEKRTMSQQKYEDVGKKIKQQRKVEA